MSFAPPRRPVCAILHLVFAAGCAGTVASSSTSQVAPAVPATEPAALSTSGSAVPSAPASEIYTTDTSAPDTSDALATQFATEIDKIRRKRGLPPMVRDGRLDRSAHDIALLTAEEEIPSFDATASLLSYYGVVEPNPGMLLKQGADGAEPDAVSGLDRELTGNAVFSKWRRFGIGVKRTPGKWMAVLIFHEKTIDLSPVPRRLPSSGSAPISGRIPSSLHAPEVLVSPPRGAVAALALTDQQGRFSSRFECNQGNGPYQIEVVAQDVRGPTVVANFPVYCGVQPSPPILTRSARVARVSDPTTVEEQLFQLVNQDRQAHGLAALTRDAALSRIARRYSQEMAEAGEVAHVSKRSGTVVDRLKAARVSPLPTTIAENVATALTAPDAESGFMASPGHRDNILNPVVTRVGVGVAIGREEGGVVPLFFTQVFGGYGR